MSDAVPVARIHGGEDAATEATRRVVLAYVAALNAHDPDAVAACVSDDFVSEHPSRLGRGRGLVGRPAYRERLPTFLAEFDDLHYEIEHVIADGDLAAIPYRMTATWTGEPGARHPISLRGVFRLRVGGGLVVERTDYWDSADFLDQTGR